MHQPFKRDLGYFRRKGSNPEMITASGVSSIIRSMPVAASMAQMRPSRPMMRPFMASLGWARLKSWTQTRSPAPRNRSRDDFACFPFGILPGFFQCPFGNAGHIETRLTFHFLQQMSLGLVGGHSATRSSASRCSLSAWAQAASLRSVSSFLINPGPVFGRRLACLGR